MQVVPRRFGGQKRRRYEGGAPALPRRLKGFYRRGGFYKGRKAAPRGAPVEKKYFDTKKAATSAGVAGTIFDDSLNEVPQGAGESDRVGRKITVTDVLLKGLLTTGSGTVAASIADTYRIILYLDKQCNGATAAATDILEGVVDINAFRNLEEGGRFRILSDSIIEGGPLTNAGGTAATVDRYQCFHIYKSVKIPIEFNGATGAIAEIRSNNIGVLVVSAGANAGTTLSYTARIRYTDV